jgi:transposase-like protein
MDQLHVLRHKVLKEGQSIRRIARELGLSRNTVTKSLDRPRAGEKFSASARAAGVGSGEAAARGAGGGVGAPDHRQAAHHCNAASSAASLRRLSSWQNSLLGDYWRERRRQRAEVYVPLIHRAGEAPIDFFEVVVEVGGERRKV